MYSKVVYDYFNSNPKNYKFKPNKLTRKNAFKKKVTNKTVPKKPNTSTGILKSSSPIEDSSQKATYSTESKSSVYDTVQCIWKYAKSFISNQNSDSSRYQDRLRKQSKYRSKSRNNNLPSLRSVLFDTFPKDFPNEKEKSCEPIKTTNEKLSNENIPQETEDNIMEKATQHEKADEDFLTIENLETTINQELKAQSLTEVHSVCKELDLYVCNTNNDKSTYTNSDRVASKESQTIKPYDEDASLKMSIKKNQQKNIFTEVYIKQQDLQNNNQGENLNDMEMQIPKSSMKTYGRGKRRNKKLLQVHFADEYNNEKRKYSSYKSKFLRKSDCYHPNAFYKKLIMKHLPEKNKSAHSIRGKKTRLTKTSKPTFRKKISKRSSSSNISFQSKSSDSYKNKAAKKTLKNYSVYKTEHSKNYKKPTTNEKGIKALQEVIKTMANNKFDEPVNLSYNDTNELLKAINIGDELCSSQHSISTGCDNFFGKSQDICKSNNLLEELNEFAEFINDEYRT